MGFKIYNEYIERFQFVSVFYRHVQSEYRLRKQPWDALPTDLYCQFTDNLKKAHSVRITNFEKHDAHDDFQKKTCRLNDLFVYRTRQSCGNTRSVAQ